MLINEVAEEIGSFRPLDASLLRLAKDHGFSDVQIAALRGLTESEVRVIRHALGVRPVFKTVDTCAGGVPRAHAVPLLELRPGDRGRARATGAKVVILGSGPNRIGQGVEFDYSCVHASFALSDAGYETIMINCNPETVSTDYDTSDRLYFEPLTLEDVLEVIHAESQSGELVGVVVQLGGQTALGLAQGLKDAGVPILGTTPEAIDLAEERGLFSGILDAAGLLAPRNGVATDYTGAVVVAEDIGYPVLVRPSYVLGGRGMEIVYDTASLADYFEPDPGSGHHRPLAAARRPLPRRRDRDRRRRALRRHRALHRRRHGAHRGGRHPLRRLGSCTLPPVTLGRDEIDRVREATLAIAEGIGVRGLLNVQFAIGAGVLYVLEANPRASRTVPFVAEGARHPAREGGRADHGRHDHRRAQVDSGCCRVRTVPSCRWTPRSR